MRTRLRLLFLLPHVPALEAPHGGGRSTAHLIRALARRHDVAVLCLRRSVDEVSDEDIVRVCSSYEEVQHAMIRDGRPLRRLRHRLLPLVRTPGWVLATEDSAYRRRLRSLVAHWRPDIVHIAYHVMGQYADVVATSDVRFVLTQHESGVVAAHDALRRARGVRRVTAGLKRLVWSHYERRIMRRMDAIVVFTQQDQAMLPRLTGRTRVMRIPLGIAIPERPLNPTGVDKSVLFVGNFSHPPNVDAAARLVQSIFPAVRGQCADAQLTIVGANPPAEITSGPPAPQVTVTGRVSTIEPFLDRACVVVAPLWEGGGMRVKVLEALAAGKAVVASPLAASGLDVTSGSQLIIARDNAEFATAIVRLLRDPHKRVDLARNGRDWAITHLQWDQIAAKYDELHDHITTTENLKPLAIVGEQAN